MIIGKRSTVRSLPDGRADEKIQGQRYAKPANNIILIPTDSCFSSIQKRPTGQQSQLCVGWHLTRETHVRICCMRASEMGKIYPISFAPSVQRQARYDVKDLSLIPCVNHPFRSLIAIGPKNPVALELNQPTHFTPMNGVCCTTPRMHL